MSERPSPPAEAELIATAQKRSRLSNRKAAKRAGMSEGRWRQIIQGYQTVSGVHVPVRAPADTLARMAHAVGGVAPEQLAVVGREDAAEELRTLPLTGGSQSDESTVERLETRVARLERELAERDESGHGADYPEDPLVRILDEDPAELSRKLSPEQLRHYIDRLNAYRDALVTEQQQREEEAQPNGR